MPISDSTLRQRLATILVADVAGYSRLMQSDESGTVAALDKARAVFRESVAACEGRIVDMAGDSVLAVFDSANSGVKCALAVQRTLLAGCRDQPDDCRMRFRIGVHLGDVMEKGDGSVYGDGVNIAARLEALAEPGGIAISEPLLWAVKKRVDAEFEDFGEHAVKNIAEPVRTFRFHPDPLARLQPSPVAANEPAAARPSPARERADKPSIAVLPFVNMSGDPEQEFFADGITEDILTELSRFRELFVISRNSTFKFKGRAVNVQEFAAELGVQYVVEGSVRKVGQRVRITVQLIDASTDRHLWAERYDRDLEDIFAIQDEVTTAIAATLPGRVEAAARDRAGRRTTGNMDAYECALTGKVLHHRSNREDNARALALLERAIELDPGYAHAYAWKACVLGQRWVYNWCESRPDTEVLIKAALEIALALDDNDSDVHRILAAINLIQENYELASYHQRRALSLNPNDDLVVVQQGELLTWFGQPIEGIDWIRKAMRLNPYHPERFWNHLARACFAAGRHDDAIEALRCISSPDVMHRASLAACHAERGDAAAAAEQVRLTLALSPGFGIGEYLASLHYRDPADRDRHRQALARAGFPA